MAYTRGLPHALERTHSVLLLHYYYYLRLERAHRLSCCRPHMLSLLLSLRALILLLLPLAQKCVGMGMSVAVGVSVGRL